MKKIGQNLFQIGEVTKSLGVTRKALLVYEEMGLLTPAHKNENSGYRYYSVDNMVQIRAIRSMQEMGLSLKEVAEYYYDTENLDKHLERLLELRSALDKNIQRLQVRTTKPGDLTVRKAILPHQFCFCRRHTCRDIPDASAKLSETYVAAAHAVKLHPQRRMFAVFMSLSADPLDLMCCIPVEDSFDGPDCVEMPEMPALCIYYRGPYKEAGIAVHALTAYMEEHGIEAAGPFRATFLEGPPTRGENSSDYITQVAVPIKS